jgi:hypothetical protein
VRFLIVKGADIDIISRDRKNALYYGKYSFLED